MTTQHTLLVATKTLFADQLEGWPVGLGDLPWDQTEPAKMQIRDHYVILYPLGDENTVDRGTMGNQYDTFLYKVQATIVGTSIMQVSWAQDRIRDVLVAKQGSGYAYELDVGADLEYREQLESGAVEKTDNSLWLAHDVYCFSIRSVPGEVA